MTIGPRIFRCIPLLLTLSGLLVGGEHQPSAEEFVAMNDAAKKHFLIKTFQTWDANCQNIIAKTSNYIRRAQIPPNELWLPLKDIDVSQQPRSEWRCGIFRLNGEFGKTIFETNSFPVGLTHRSRTSCLPSASSNTENFNRLAFWLKTDFDAAIHFPFFESTRYIEQISFHGLSAERYVVIEFPIDSKNNALEIKRTMWLDTAHGFLPVKTKTSVTRDTRVGKSRFFGITHVSQFKLVNGVVIPIEFIEYVTRPTGRKQPISFYHTLVDEVKIRRKS